MSPPKPEVLVVDDSEELAEAMALMLADAGYETRVAHNGRAALAAAKQRRPALILTDGLMPEMSGLELLTALRSDLAPPVPPVVIVSGFPELEQDALRRGAADFLHKPVSPADLVAGVARVLARLARLPEVAEQARQRALASRRQISAAAAAAFEQLQLGDGEVRAAAARMAAWLVGYFGFGTASVVLIRPDAIEALAEVRGSRAGVATARSAHPFLRDVAETRSSLLVADTQRHAPAFASMATTGGIRFFAAAPVVATDGTPIGAIALLDVVPRAFAAGDLRLLEHVGRTGSDRIADALDPRPRLLDPFVDDAGILTGRAFKAFLATELDLAAQCGVGIALAITECAVGEHPVRVPPAGEARARLGVGRLSAERIGLFKRDSSVDQARSVLDAALGGHEAGEPASSAAVLTLGPAAVRLMDARTALELTESAVSDARRRGCSVHVSLSVEGPPWRGPRAAP